MVIITGIVLALTDFPSWLLRALKWPYYGLLFLKAYSFLRGWR